MGYPLNRLDEPVFIAVSKPLLTECIWVLKVDLGDPKGVASERGHCILGQVRK